MPIMKKIYGLISETRLANTARGRRQSSPQQNQPRPMSPDGASSSPDANSELALLQADLWNEAYDELKASEPKLLETYERILSSKLAELPDMDEETCTPNDIAQNPKKRSKQMYYLAQMGLEKTKKAVSFAEKTERGLQIFTAIKGVVSTALKAAPQAAVAWTGVCLGLEILVTPISELQSQRKGLAYVLERVEWYWQLAHLLLGQEATILSCDGLNSEMRPPINKLYQMLLEYQIRSICIHNRHSVIYLGANMLKLDDWNSKLNAIKELETLVRNNAKQYHNVGFTLLLQKIANNTNAWGQGLEKITDDMQESNMEAERTRKEEKDNACLRDLLITDPRLDKERIESINGGLLEESYTWVVQHQDFRRFYNNANRRLLWITGDAGTGKTMLMCGIIDYLGSSSELQPTYQLSYFFCQQTDSQLNNATAVLRGLLFTILSRQPHLLPYLTKLYESHGREFFDNKNTWVALKKAFYNLIQSPRMMTTIVLVDALDECATGRTDLLTFIRQCIHLETTSLKWIVSSRNQWIDIDETMSSIETKVQLQLELNSDLVSAAIFSYIDKRLNDLAVRKRYSEADKNSIGNYLREHANGTFLWVALVCQKLADVRRTNAFATVLKFPAGLNTMYRRMLHDIGMTDDAAICREVLATACLVYRPLSLQEFTALVPVMSSYSPWDVRQIIKSCGSFLTLREDLVQFIHQSAKDFLLSKDSDDVFPLDIVPRHRSILISSLEAMAKVLKRDLYNLKCPGYLIQDITPPEPDPLAPISYSCLHWVAHLKEALSISNAEIADGGLIDRFIQQKYLYWLECLALLRRMGNGGIVMSELQLIIPSDTSPALTRLVVDACRFLRLNKAPIEEAPLQAYASALLFAPEKSLIRQMFQKDKFKWMHLQNAPESDWSPCMHTLERKYDDIVSIAFTPDSQRVIAMTSDFTAEFEVWDTATGDCLERIEVCHQEWFDMERIEVCHQEWFDITSAISPDGKTVSVGRSSGDIEIWNIEEGARIQTLEGHLSKVEAIVFSPDAQSIISSSLDGTIRRWDIKSGACSTTYFEKLVRLGEDWTGRHYLSPGGQWLAIYRKCRYEEWRRDAPDSMDYYTTIIRYDSIKIYDTISGKLMTSHDNIVDLAFTEDGKQFATLSAQSAVKVWDTDSFTCLRTIDAGCLLHEDRFSVDSIKMSPDGSILLSVTESGAIDMWSTTAGTLLKTLNGREAKWPITFSRDGKKIASASTHGSILVWDTEVELSLQRSQGHSMSVSAVVFSPDNTKLASSSNDGTIKIWETRTSTCLTELKYVKKNNFITMNFSALGSRLLIFDNCIASLWDAIEGTCLATMNGITRTIDGSSSVWKLWSAFLMPDGNKVLCGVKNSILIWDVASATCLTTLDGHNDVVSDIAASPDGKRLAVFSGEDTITIWDLVDFRRITTFSTEMSPGGRLRFSANSLHVALHEPWAPNDLFIWSCEDGTETDLLTCDISTVADWYPYYALPSTMLTADGCVVSSGPRMGGSDAPSYVTVSKNRRWLVSNGCPIIWLPPMYRIDWYDSIAATRSKIIIGSSSGKVLFFELNGYMCGAVSNAAHSRE